jgi:hypothetical protein
VAGGEADLVKDRASALQLLLVLGVVALGHASLLPNVADLDGFYHVGHAGAYLQGSLLDTSLPWASRSIIARIGGDLWWGFHVLLLPAAALFDVPTAMQVSSVMLTAGLALTMLALLRRHGVRYAGLWAALFLLAVPNVFYRYVMVRPHVISLAASVAILSFLVKGRWWHVLLLSALLTWVHLSLFWVAPLLVGAYAVSRVPVTALLGAETPDTGVPIRQAIPAALAGVLIGWLARPDAVATASLLNVQLVQLFAQKALDQPLTFAAELAPIRAWDVLRTSGSFLAVWITGVVLTVWATVKGRLAGLGQARATLLVTALALSAAFLLLALVSARRALEQWVAFGFLFLPLVTAALGCETIRPDGAQQETVQGETVQRETVQGETGAGDAAVSGRGTWTAPRALGLVLVVLHLGWFGDRHMRNVREVSFSSSTLAPVAAYLEEHSDPNDVVFHARWDNFGPLFAFNRHNRYLSGMDPIFQYAYDARSFWEFFYLSTDLNQEWTCDAYPCRQGNATDTHQVLREHFGARWVVVQPYRNPRLTLYLLNDERYDLALETQSDALFEIRP